MNAMYVARVASKNLIGVVSLTSWKLMKHKQLVLEGPIDIIISTMKRMGNDYWLRINIDESIIEILTHKEEFDRSKNIRNGMRQRQLEKFRRYPNFIEDPSFKFCTGCKVSKNFNEFGYRKGSPDGRARQCLDCVNKQAKIRRKRNKSISRLDQEEDN